MRHPDGKLPPEPLPEFEHINQYWDKGHSTFAAKILPGEYYVTVENEVIVTVLGSCISACIRDPVFGVGGMNHFMLPEGDQEMIAQGATAATRYGNHAMEQLINDILKHGGSRKNLEVKIFGGGKVLAQMTDVGDKNIRFITEYIATEGLKLVASDVGNIYPRKVYYFPLSGKVRMKKLRSIHNNTVIEREVSYQKNITCQPVAGEVELF
ncbi:MAG: chemoreceptor glutamine deamidase CheD [Gammaproteobacteria bacterium]|nr:chemoreceptor glutamine deamidase CheD [Gammaproteobacteria bacterium]